MDANVCTSMWRITQPAKQKPWPNSASLVIVLRWSDASASLWSLEERRERENRTSIVWPVGYERRQLLGLPLGQVVGAVRGASYRLGDAE